MPSEVFSSSRVLPYALLFLVKRLDRFADRELRKFPNQLSSNTTLL